MKQNLYILLAVLCLANVSTAQEGMSGFFMKNTLQRSHFNPALYDDKAVNISLGNFSGSLHSTGNNLLGQTTVDANGNTIVDINAIERKEVKSYAYGNLGTLEMSFRIDSTWFLSAGHRIKAQVFSLLSEDMINLAIDGNAPYIGQTLNLSPNLNSTIYSTVYLGLAKKLGKFDVGVRMSLLSGLQNFSFESSKLDLTTSDEFYQLQFDNDLLLNSSGGIIYNGLDDISTDFESPSYGSNSGVAFDLGVSYRVNDQLTLSAAAIDLGSITWSDSPQNFASNGQFEYDGIDISEFITDDIEIEFTDTLKEILQVVETNNEYSTSIASRYTIGGEYLLNRKIRLGALVAYRNIADQSYTSFALNASAKLFKWIDLGLIYSSKPGDAFNLGLHTVLNFGPVQFLFASDNVLGVDLSESTSAHIRGGFAVRI